MSNEQFIELCKQKVYEYEKGNTNALLNEVFVVWSCKTLQNSKALLSAKPRGAYYYELTMNGDKEEIYMDVYTKLEHLDFYFNGKKVDRMRK